MQSHALPHMPHAVGCIRDSDGLGRAPAPFGTLPVNDDAMSS